MEKTIDVSFIYGISAVVSLLLACGYCTLVRKKEMWLIWLFFSVFIANLGYFALSISSSLEEALLANRIAYLGCVCLPLFMLMTIMKVCQVNCSKRFVGVLIGISVIVFLIAASQGYTDWYYKEVSLVFVNGMAKIKKVYGTLHKLYFVYLFTYFGLMLGTIWGATKKKKLDSYKHAGLLVVVVFLNIMIWLVEQLINWDFEFLSISYISSELLLLLLYGMIQDYESSRERRISAAQDVPEEVNVMDKVRVEWPEFAKLTEREKDVLEKMLEDKKRKEIADELCISENTVKKHISNIFSKLNVESRKELLEIKNQNISSLNKKVGS